VKIGVPKKPYGSVHFFPRATFHTVKMIFNIKMVNNIYRRLELFFQHNTEKVEETLKIFENDRLVVSDSYIRDLNRISIEGIIVRIKPNEYTYIVS